MKLNLPKIDSDRKTFLQQSMTNTLMFNGLLSDLSRRGYDEQLAQMQYLLELEMAREEGARRSIAKRIHGRTGTLRAFLEWELVEEPIRA